MAHRGTRRLIVGAAGLLFLAALGVAVDYAIRLTSIGAAYKAKMLCSGVFVSGRDPQEVLAELEVDDLFLLRYVGASIDRAARSATARIPVIVSRQAIYREGLGCALALDGKTPGGLPGEAAARRVQHPGVSAQPAHGNLEAAAIGAGADSARLKAAIDRAFDEPDAQRLRRTRAVVIVRKGQILAERYAGGIGPDTPLMGWSLTKGVMNALAGILVGDGRLSMTGPVPIPEWQKPGDPRGRITLDQLLRMSSGLRFDEDMADPLADVTVMLLGSADAAGFAIDKELEAQPGSRWHYASGTSNIIARLARNVLQNDAEYLTFPRRALFDRIGMTSAVLETDASGTFVGSSFMYATARDWARFGMLYLQDGVWNGERILPDGWVAYTRTPAPADPQGHYGAHFWLDVPDDYRGAGGSLPAGAFHAAGHEAQFVTIVPSHDVVIVRLGLTRYPSAWDHPAFVRDVLDALGPAARPAAWRRPVPLY